MFPETLNKTHQNICRKKKCKHNSQSQIENKARSQITETLPQYMTKKTTRNWKSNPVSPPQKSNEHT
jgi:hypothetical protein